MTQILSRRKLLIGTATLGAAAVGASVTSGFGLIPSAVAAQKVFTVDGVAIRGADPVAYFTKGKAVIGSADFSHEWNGATWHFANAEHRDKFAASPEKFAPAYGGFCAWAIAAKSDFASTQPENWAIVDGRLFLNFNDAVQARWDQDRPGYIKKGDEVWPTLVS